MKATKGIVSGESVRIAKGADLADGQEVFLIPVRPALVSVRPSPECMDEDLAFVRSCRGRLGRQVEAEDARGPS